jgi:hypothetical protein
MRRITFLTAALALIGLFTLTWPAQAQESSIVGAWITESWEGEEGDPQPGLLIFTETNYSMMFVPAGMTREQYTGEEMTEAEMVAAMQTLVANSGRYTREGDQITTEAYVALNPNYMANWGENHLTYTFKVEGDLLHLTWPAGFAGADNPPFTGTFRKVG